MNKFRGKKWLRIGLLIAGALVILCMALTSIRFVKNTLVESEEESLSSVALVAANDLDMTFRSKINLVYAAFAGDMSDENEITGSFLKIGEKCRYIRISEASGMQGWEYDKCVQAAQRPGEVVPGPIEQEKDGDYILHLTKAVYMNRSIAGYVIVDLNLQDIYEDSKGLSVLELANDGHCVVENANGTRIMPADDESGKHTHEGESGCKVQESFEVESGNARRTRTLVAYHQLMVGDEALYVCVVEDYDMVVAPIERVTLYLVLLGIALLVWIGILGYKLVAQNKEEEMLKRELAQQRELNKANEALKKQENLMQKYNHSQTNAVLTGAIAHEFNNMMTPIVLYTELLAENEVVNNEMPDEIEELLVAVKRSEELAHQLLDYSRQGRAQKVLSDYNATLAIQTSVNMVEKLMPANIKLEASVCKTQYYVRGQIGTLNQIVLNLVTNSKHAIGEKKGNIQIQFGLDADDSTKVRLVVSDDGGGIPKEVQRHVFEPFFTTKSEKEGTGIGLTVVKRLVEEHGGTIKAKNEEGVGVTFIMDFPIVNSDEKKE